jgi:predicted ATPase/DNA-binding SARP family transcriptional activator
MSNQELSIWTFGTLRIEQNEAEIEGFVTLKAALLFCYLAMNKGKHKRESLAALLWSETPDIQALKNLRTILSSLRKTVPEFISIDAETIAAKGQIWIDAEAFANTAEHLLQGQKLSLDEMQAAVHLYTSDFLQDIYIRQGEGIEEWISYKRDELQQKYLQVLYQIVETCLETGEIYRGVEYARHLVRLNPFWEAAQRQLMLLLVHLHQSGEALMQYERLAKLLKTELETEPETETLTLYQKIKGRMIQAAAKKNERPIVLPDLPYILPKKEIQTLRELLDKGASRLITLLGFGGTGKSSLALFIAHERQKAYHDGVLMVSLRNVVDAQELAKNILSRLKVPSIGKDAPSQVIEELRDREMLLVLDNYEQLIPETALVKAILDELPGIQIIVTSQTPLNLREEQQINLRGLTVQESPESEALQLFKKTAERLLPQFEIRAYREEIYAICQELEGLPLGIVIAASQVKYLSPPEILKTLRSNILAFKSNYQDLPAQHQSFAQLVQASLEHLSATERKALLALTIFRGSFDHAAALAVADIDLSVFISLVDKSLIQRVSDFRYSLHSLLRRVFSHEFAILPEKDLIRQRFTQYYQDWALLLYQQCLPSIEAARLIDIEVANLWHFDLLNLHEKERYALEIIPALENYVISRGYTDEFFTILKTAILNPQHPQKVRVRGMLELALIAVQNGEADLAQSLSEEALQLAPDSLYIQVQARQILGRLALQSGNLQYAKAELEKVLELEKQKADYDDPQINLLFIGTHVGLGLILRNLGEIESARAHYMIVEHAWQQLNLPPRLDIINNLAILDMAEKNYEAAKGKYLELLRLAEENNHTWVKMSAYANLGEMFINMADYEAAFLHIKNAIEIGMRMKRIPSVMHQLEGCCRLAFFVRNYPFAAQLRGFIFKAFDEYKLHFGPAAADTVREQGLALQELLGTDYPKLLAIGESLSLQDAVALANSLAHDFEAIESSDFKSI